MIWDYIVDQAEVEKREAKLVDVIDQVSILNVNVGCIDKQQLLSLVSQWVTGNQSRLISYVNAHCLNVAYKNSSYRAYLNKADLIYTDGIGVVWAGRLLGNSNLHKITGRDWIFDLCKLSVKQNWKIYILAGKAGIARRAGNNLVNKYPGLWIVGTNDGYFKEKSEAEVLEELNKTNPDILLVGMGVPRQEFWIYKNRKRLPKTVCWAVGAIFDYIADTEPRVPGWMDNLALEWLWRLLLDPGGKWKRYLVGIPIFIARVLRQKFTKRER